MGRGERGFEGVGSAVDEEDGKLVGAGEGAKVEREMVVGDFHADLGIAGVGQTGGIGFGQELVAQEIAGERERIVEENAVLNFDGERAFGNGGRRRVAGDGKEGGLSPKRIQNLHIVLHAALSKAVRLGKIPSDPSAETVRPKVSEPEMRVLGKEEMQLFLSEILKEHSGPPC